MTRRTKPGPDRRDGRGETGGRRRMRLSRRELMRTAPAPARPPRWAGPSRSPTRSSRRARGRAAARGELFYGSTSRFDTLDPNITTFTDVARIGFHLFDPLLWEAKAGEFVPGLAERWEVSPSADRYTFHLRKDVKFHDGTRSRRTPSSSPSTASSIPS